MSGKQKTIPLAPSSPEVEGHLQTAAAKAAAESLRPPPAFQKGSQLALAFQWSEADAVQAIRVLEWAIELRTRCPDMGVLRPLVVHFCPLRTPEYLVTKISGLLESLGFLEHSRIVPQFDLPDERYPRGSVWGFWHIAQWACSEGVDFMLMEPDAIPLTASWWSRIVAEWEASKMPYVGHIEPAHPSGGYRQHMAGCGIYHHDVWRNVDTSRLDLAFDVALGEHVVPLAQQSVCIQQVFGSTEPPRFRSQMDVDRIIRKDAVLFHRNKDGSLIQLLRERGVV
jgi:hypothetical protein